MAEVNVRAVPEALAASAHVDNDAYLAMYQRSVDDPESFWAEQAQKYLTFMKPWNQVCDYDFHKGEARWFDGATLNVSVNCIDRHLATRGDQTAIIWEADEPGNSTKVSYNQLSQEVNKLANLLRERGVKRVTESVFICP
jgi:acetyl-CoA synthetase